MKNGYEQIVENMQTQAGAHLNGISLYANERTVKKASEFRETITIGWNVFTQNPGYNPLFWWKTTLYCQGFL